MVGIHVRLDLEDEAGDFAFAGLDGARFGVLGARRRGIVRQRGDQLGDAEILQGRAEIDRRLMALRVGRPVEAAAGAAHQFDLLFEMGLLLVAEDGGKRIVTDAARMRAAHGEGHELVRGQVVDPAEIEPHAAGPVHRHAFQLQLVGDLVEQFDGIARLAVHLVDEGDDGDIAQAADLEQLAGLRLDALGGVDHHHRAVGGGQRAIGVFRKVLMARRVEQIEDGPAIFEGHHRRGDGDAALLLDLHPVRTRAPRLAAGLDLTGRANGAAQEQEMLGQRGLAGVRMRDDRKGAPSCRLRGGRIGRGFGRRRSGREGRGVCHGARA